MATAQAVDTSTTPPAQNKRDLFPAGIPFIVGNEGAERFSFYGMKAILKIYLIQLFVRFAEEATLPAATLAAARAHSTEIVHLFVAGVYAFPLIGAVISDRLLGKYNTILFVSLIYCVGHAVLAVAGRLGEMGMYEATEMSMYLGLLLIAMGSGGIKPCVSANVGDQFTAENGHLVTKIFQIFYFIINYGSFFSTLLTPLLYRWYGPEVAFGVPGVLMGVATFVFWMGRDKFIRVPPKPGGKLGLIDTLTTTCLFSPLFALIVGYFVLWEGFYGEAAKAAGGELPVTGALVGAFFAANWWLVVGAAALFITGVVLFAVRQRMQPDTGFLAVLLYSLKNQKSRKPGQSFFDPAREKFGEEAGDGPPAVLKIMVVFSMVSVFWALFDQHASTWIDQAKQMALGLTAPAYLGYWGVGAVVGLSLFAGVWLFKWISNNPFSSKVTKGVLGLAGVTGAIAGLLDLVGPPMGNLLPDGTRERLISFQMDAAQLSALNPVMVMMIIPLLNVLVYDPLKKRGVEVKPLHKMVAGMFLAAVAFGSAALLQMRIEAAGDGVIHGLWQAGPYFLMTTSEVLVSITGLEFAYTQAPRAMKSTLMGFWLLTVTFGNLLVAFLAPLQKTYSLSSFFLLFTGLMAGAALVFAVLAYFYKGKTYLQEASGH